MLKWEMGDIWDYEGNWDIVIPTNAGWRKDGRNIMGRGLARQAAKELAVQSVDLPLVYGKYCQLGQPRVYLVEHHLILVPTKPLIEDAPHLSWKQDADIRTVEDSLVWLFAHSNVFRKRVAVPLLGAGNGGLLVARVKNLMEAVLGNDTSGKFVGILKED